MKTSKYIEIILLVDCNISDEYGCCLFVDRMSYLDISHLDNTLTYLNDDICMTNTYCHS